MGSPDPCNLCGSVSQIMGRWCPGMGGGLRTRVSGADDAVRVEVLLSLEQGGTAVGRGPAGDGGGEGEEGEESCEDGGGEHFGWW